MRNLLINGFPARLHYRMERWATGGWFDDIKAAAEWDVVVKYDALSKRYHVFRAVGNRAVELGSFETAAEAEEIVNAPFRAPVSLPRRGQRTYYNLVLDIETLSLTELDEVERWLRGELKPEGLSSLEVNLVATEILDAARKSAKTGKRVDLK